MAVIDHLVYFVPDLAESLDVAEARYGIRPVIGGRHVGRGTHNALLALGDCYLELIAPDPDQPEPATPRPFGIDARAAAGFVTFAARPAPGETLDDLIEALRAVGADPGAAASMSRATPAGDELRWRLTTPDPAFGGAVPFLIDWGDTPKPHTTAPAGPTLTGLTVHTPAAARVSAAIVALGLDDQIDVVDGEFDLTPTFSDRSDS